MYHEYTRQEISDAYEHMLEEVNATALMTTRDILDKCQSLADEKAPFWKNNNKQIEEYMSFVESFTERLTNFNKDVQKDIEKLAHGTRFYPLTENELVIVRNFVERKKDSDSGSTEVE